MTEHEAVRKLLSTLNNHPSTEIPLEVAIALLALKEAHESTGDLDDKPED